MNIAQKLVFATISIAISFTVLEQKSVQAITLTVTNTGDNISDTGSLRYAIDQANKTAGTDTIDFSLPAVPLTINLTGGSLDITSDLNINGLGANLLTIDGNRASSVLSISSTSTVGIFGLTIANGNNGILNQGNLTVTNSIISGSQGDEFYFNNSGISSTGGNLTVTNSTFSSNQGAGIYSYGNSNITVTNSTFSGNGGAGIDSYNDSNIIVANSTFSGNDGGGINGFSSNITATNSTFSDNSTGISGIKGNITATNNTIFSNGIGLSSGFGDLTVTNNTISGNGTGISSFRASITVINSTIFGNQGLGIRNSSSSFGLKNTIVAKNSRDGIYPADLSGTNFSDLGNNLIGTGDLIDGAPPEFHYFTNGVNGNIVGTLTNPIDPLLGPLANNGGITLTHALLPGSPAIDAANSNSFPPTDQRGVLRPQGAKPDIGAYELLQTPKSVPEPSNLSGIFLGVGLGWSMKRKVRSKYFVESNPRR
jgi:parallel beta-helix repeat protein